MFRLFNSSFSLHRKAVMATELCEDVTSFTCVGWAWLWTSSSARVDCTFWHWNNHKQMEYDVPVSLLTLEFDGPWSKECTTTALCRGSAGCDDGLMATPSKNSHGDEALWLPQSEDMWATFLPHFYFLLMKMNILKAVLVWNNTS